MANLEAEKGSLLRPIPELKRESTITARSSYRRDLLLVICAVAVTSFFHWFSPSKLIESRPSREAQKAFSFDNIKPSRTLEFHDCHDGFKCARLEVPLDWNATDPTEGTQVALAIIKKPARVPVTDPRYGGAILLNPGGPGGSGVNLVYSNADRIQKVVDAEEDVLVDPNSASQYFDIMSWDPRGVNNTTPRFSCFPDDLTRQRWEVESDILGFNFRDPEIFHDVWTRERTRGKGCADIDGPGAFNRVNGNEHLGLYTSTASVVQDIVEIIERHGEWRENEAKRILSKSCSDSRKVPIPESLAWKKGEEQLLYWGFSYLILGQYFATLQPHRVGKLALDGVVDVQNYADVKWTENLNDITKLTEQFTVYCAEAGPEHCALGDQSPKDILANMERLFKDLEAKPLPAYTKEGGPRVITSSNVKLDVFNAWYKPSQAFKSTASTLLDLMNGNISSFASQKDANRKLSCPLPHTPLGGDTWSNSLSFACNDGPDLTGETLEEFQRYVNIMNKQSDWFGNRWSLIRLPCLGYKSPAKWRYPGPFGAKTANPILFASQQYDPVTPLQNAVGAVDLFPGSGYVVSLGGLGHCTLAMPSLCTAKTIRHYFQTGEVPGAGGAQCPTEGNPFIEIDAASYDVGDAKLLEALEGLTSFWE